MEDDSEFTIGFDRNYDNNARKELRLSQDRSIRGNLVIAPSASNVVYIRTWKEK